MTQQKAGSIGLGLVLVVTAGFCFAATPTMARLAYDGGSTPLTVALSRFVIAAIVMVALMGLKGYRLPKERGLLVAGVLIGVCFAFQSLAYLSSVQFVSVPMAVLVFFTFPVLATFLVRLVEGSPLTAPRLAAAGLAFLGVALTTGAAPVAPDPRGLGLALLAAIGTATYIVFGAGISRRVGPIRFNAMAMVTAAFIFTTSAVLVAAPVLPVTGWGWVGLIGSGVMFVIASLCFFGALAMLDTLRATLMTNLEPLFAIGIAFVLLGELLTGVQAIGATMVIGAVLLPGVLEAFRRFRGPTPAPSAAQHPESGKGP